MTTLLKEINASLDELNRVVLGKEKQVQLALACILANGHLLIEDLPGMGKRLWPMLYRRCLG